MVADPDALVGAWLEAGVKRVIVHSQTVRNLNDIAKKVEEYGAGLMIAFDPSQDIEKAKEYITNFDQFQVLTVPPGPSGQEFSQDALDRIKFLRQLGASARIEVDGGINLETGKKALEAGADILVSGSYIFSHPDPKKAFEELNSL